METIETLTVQVMAGVMRVKTGDWRGEDKQQTFVCWDSLKIELKIASATL